MPVCFEAAALTPTFVLITSLATTVVCAALLLNSRLRKLFADSADKPQALHSEVTPRLGGVAIIFGVLAATIAPILSNVRTPVSFLLLISLTLAVVSVLDDLFELSAAIRLMWHAFSSVMLLLGLANFYLPSEGLIALAVLPQAFGLLIIVIGLVWMINLYNFMDGANGLAGFMGLIGFCALAIAVNASPIRTSETQNLVMLCLSVSGACGGFLFFNFPRARLFMGDAGSVFLGSLAGGTAVVGCVLKLWQWWFVPLVFSPFIVDASFTLLKRIFKREKIWLPHRQHIYQRLIVVCRWSHSRTTLMYVVMMLLASIHALWWQWTSGRSQVNGLEALFPLSIVLPWVVTYAVLLVAAEWKIRRPPLTKTNMSLKEDQRVR